MKREGRQHGMVRTYRILPPPLNPRPGSRPVNALNSPPTAGLFTKVPSRPTNHSKFTGKCGQPRCLGCHIHPTTKAKVKTKGLSKLTRSNDITTSYKLLTWRVVDGRPGLNFSGFSASGILDQISDGFVDENDCDYDEQEDGDEEITAFQTRAGTEIVDDGGENDDDNNKDGGPHDYHRDDDDEDEKMSFCDVGIIIDHVEEDDGEGDWCLVEEMMILDL